MLLTELTGVKHLTNKSAGEILMQLKKQGITMARGVYGIVLMHPNWDYVIKFFPKDECYMLFLKFCQEHKSKHLPVIKKGPMSIKSFFRDKYDNPVSDVAERFYAVKLEKLAPMPTDGEINNAAFIITQNASFYKKAMSNGTEDEFLKQTEKEYKETKPAKLKKYKSLAETIVDIYDACDSNKCRLDIHQGNLMMRGNTIVVIDPYSAVEKGKELTLLKFISKMDLDKLTKS